MSASRIRLPQQTSVADHDRPHIHPPKRERFDLAAKTNTDPKGFVRAVDEYRVEPFGLYMAREIVGHPRLAYVESWLLPAFGLRISDLRYRPGAEQDLDYYLDIAQISPGGEVWHTVDHYLDIVVRDGRGAEVLDTDELIAATLAGLIDQPTAESSLKTTYQVIDGLARTNYQVDAWCAEQNVPLIWPRRGQRCASEINDPQKT